jgi:hypothetical protein
MAFLSLPRPVSDACLPPVGGQPSEMRITRVQKKRPGEQSHRPSFIASASCQYIRGHCLSDVMGLVYSACMDLQARFDTKFG